MHLINTDRYLKVIRNRLTLRVNKYLYLNIQIYIFLLLIRNKKNNSNGIFFFYFPFGSKCELRRCRLDRHVLALDDTWLLAFVPVASPFSLDLGTHKCARNAIMLVTIPRLILCQPLIVKKLKKNHKAYKLL